MKKLAIVLTIILLPILSVAENPDSRPSISFGIGGYTSSGEYSFRGFNQDLTGRNFQFSFGSRIPVSQDVTIWGGFAYNDSRSEGKENLFYYQSISNRNALSASLGITLYIGESINK